MEEPSNETLDRLIGQLAQKFGEIKVKQSQGV